jgi:hypothetical protein
MQPFGCLSSEEKLAAVLAAAGIDGTFRICGQTRAVSRRPEKKTALAFLRLSHFRTENRIPLFLKML